MNQDNLKSIWQKIWHFLWHEDSLASWIVSLLLAFIIVKFIFFPLLSLIFSTPLPLVVVESSSMHHPGFLANTIGTNSGFEEWWGMFSKWYLENNINHDKVLKWPLKYGLEIGDIVLINGKKEYNIGDVIIFNANQKHPIIHRIVSKTEINNTLIYSTKGDNNSGQLEVEKQITKEQILGKALLRLPKVGWIKLGFVRLFS